MKQKTSKNCVDYTNSIIEGMKAARPRPHSGLGSRQPGRALRETPNKFMIFLPTSLTKNSLVIILIERCSYERGK